MASTYMLLCNDASYYVGSTTSLRLRLQEHLDGKCPYTSLRLPIQLVWHEDYDTLQEAREREMQVKKWSRIKKEKLISGEWKRLS